jgi:mannosyltransferase OCH1-like enzyme
MVETWKKSDWEYKFYDDEDAKAFLSLHFPGEISEAFNAIIPGAFKADLLRYCLLFIYGGVYADVDTILESSLDSAILSDTGFMLGLDNVCASF